MNISFIFDLRPNFFIKSIFSDLLYIIINKYKLKFLISTNKEYLLFKNYNDSH